jgi:plastocyanin
LLVPSVPQAADSALDAKIETATPSVVAGTPVRLDSSHSRGTIVRYVWDLDGDGKFETDTGEDPVAAARPGDAGPLTVGVRVVDDQGNRDDASLDLTITPPPDRSTSKSAVEPVKQSAARPADRTVSKADIPAALPSRGSGAKPKAHSSAPVARATASVKAAASSSVTIKNFLFSPKSVSVQVGDTVTWTNQDSEEHTATAKNGSFDTGSLKTGQSATEKLTKAGTIDYICTFHSNMHGTVVVAAGGGGSGSGPRSGSSSGSGSGSGSSGSSGASSGGASKSTDKSSSLPMTGLDIAAVVALAALLAGSGTLLRRRVEQRP